jgi:hypothetical protein
MRVPKVGIIYNTGTNVPIILPSVLSEEIPPEALPAEPIWATLNRTANGETHPNRINGTENSIIMLNSDPKKRPPVIPLNAPPIMSITGEERSGIRAVASAAIPVRR